MQRRIVMVGFPDAQLLDIAGPLEVFASTSRLLAFAGADNNEPAYDSVLAAPRPGPLATSGPLAVMANTTVAEVDGAIDTLIVAGGRGVRTVLKDARLIGSVRRVALTARRVASVCTGALVLAEAGLLDGRRATTHWASCSFLAERYPSVHVEPDSIYVRDGDVYTSAGVTAGMDLALALVEEDHGRDVALQCARWLVMFLKRPGGQSQFSALLSAQRAERHPLRDLQHWITANLTADLRVPILARRVGMSARNFARAFVDEVGETPGRYVESVRVEAARRKLQDSALSVEEVAEACGFGSAETMRRAFLRRVRVSPSAYRARFS